MLRRSPLKSMSSKRRERMEGPTERTSRAERPMAREAAAKTCAHCGKPFIPARPMQKVCATVRCAKGYLASQKKAERADFKRRKEAIKRIPDLIAEAQTAFNAYIRERDKAKGCFVCGRPFEDVQGRRLHAGHVRSRGAAGHLRFTEDNCMGECEGCNGPRGAKPHQIKAGAIARIGAERFAELENDNEPHKWTREELIAIRTEFRERLKQLKARNE